MPRDLVEPLEMRTCRPHQFGPVCTATDCPNPVCLGKIFGNPLENLQHIQLYRQKRLKPCTWCCRGFKQHNECQSNRPVLHPQSIIALNTSMACQIPTIPSALLGHWRILDKNKHCYVWWPAGLWVFCLSARLPIAFMLQRAREQPPRQAQTVTELQA